MKLKKIKVQFVCKWIMLFGGFIAIAARGFMILLTMTGTSNKDNWWYAAAVLVGVGIFIFLSAYYSSNWFARGLKK